MKKIILFISIIEILFSFCSTNKQQNNDIKLKDTLSINKSSIYKRYSIPLPIEIFREINKNYRFGEQCLTPLPNKETTYSQIKDAIMLGIYSADLAYCSVLENGQTTLNYSDACGFFAKELRIEDAYNTKYIDRLKNNINNTDSLIIITNNAYSQTCNLLENYGFHNIMPFVVYSGWIESLYLTFCSMPDSLEKTDFVKQIISKVKISTLINYLYDVQIETSAYYYNDQLRSLIFNLLKIQHLFKQHLKGKNSYQEIIERISKEKKELVNFAK
jgi:hypothetical protein